MKILEAQSAQLTNYEVHKHMLQLREAKKLKAPDDPEYKQHMESRRQRLDRKRKRLESEKSKDKAWAAKQQAEKHKSADVENWTPKPRIKGKRELEEEERERIEEEEAGEDIIPAPANLRTIANELIEYLEEAPSPLGSKPFPYNDQTASRLFAKLREFKLTKAEILMIVNLRPTTPSALNTVIEEMETRFEDDEQQKMVSLILEILGSPDGDAERQAMTENAKGAREAQDAKNKKEMESMEDKDMGDA